MPDPVPQLLDEVHWLIENTSTRFALCGSSARKLKRGAANLLGGRALRYELFGMTADELGGEFDLDRVLNRGYLPRMYLAERAGRLLGAYVADYLREEIAAEGLVRNVPVFSRFLDVGRFRIRISSTTRTSRGTAACRARPCSRISRS